jgi:GNAT superfamily N-acetyltransferase
MTYHVHPAVPDDEDTAAFVRARLSAYNRAYLGADRPVALTVPVTGSAGDLVGGGLAALHLGWLNIEAVWVDEGHRGHGLGERIVRALEAAALARGTRRFRLATADFQRGRRLYERLGYRADASWPIDAAGCGKVWVEAMMSKQAGS